MLIVNVNDGTSVWYVGGAEVLFLNDNDLYIRARQVHYPGSSALDMHGSWDRLFASEVTSIISVDTKQLPPVE